MDTGWGFILRLLCLEIKWRYPLSSVWIESHIALSVFGFRWLLWSERYMPVVPESATGDITKWPADRLKVLHEGFQRQAKLGKQNLTSPFWSAYSKWRADGKPDKWSDHSGVDRATAVIEKLQEGKET
jgi:hypothetical protein